MDPIQTLFADIVDWATSQLRDTLLSVAPEEVYSLVTTLKAARRVACYGVGREGLAMKGFAMRLHHQGLPVSCWLQV